MSAATTPPLPFADDAEADAEYRATRHLFTRPRVRFQPAGRTSSPAQGVVALAERGPAVAVPHGTNDGGTHLRTVPGGATPGAA